MSNTKVCNGCHQELEANTNNFYKQKGGVLGFDAKCKSCRQKHRNKYIKVCPVCGKKYRTRVIDSVACSAKCRGVLRRERVYVNCHLCGIEIETIPSRLTTREYHFCSNECRHEAYKGMFNGENNPNYNPNKPEIERIINRNIEGYNEWVRQVYQRDNYTCRCCGDNKGGNLNAHHILNYMEHPHVRIDADNGITLCDLCHKLFHDTYGYTKNNQKQIDKFINKHKIKKALY